MVSRIPDSLSCFPDSKARDSGFHKQKFPGLGRSGLKAPTRDAGCGMRDAGCGMGDTESNNHRVGMTGLDPYSMATLISRFEPS